MNIPLFTKESVYTQNGISIGSDFFLNDQNVFLGFEDNGFIHVTPNGAIVGINEMPLFTVNEYARDILLEINGHKSINEVIENISTKINQPISRVNSTVKVFLNASYSRGIIKFSETPFRPKAVVSGSLIWFSPRTSAIEITKSCDLKCKHCYASCGGNYENSYPGELHTEDWLNIIDMLSDGCERISITGGDPLVHPDFKKITNHAANNGMHVTVLTNGMRIDSETAKWFADIGVRSVKLSLDGSNEETHDDIRNFKGAYAQAVKAIDILIQNGLDVSIGSVITEKSFDQISKIADLAYSLGAGSLSFGRILKRGRALKDEVLMNCVGLDDIIREIDEVMRKYSGTDFRVTFEEGSYWVDSFYNRRPSLNEYLSYRDANLKNCMDGCGAGSYMIFISSTGEVKPCAVCDTVLGEIRNGDDLVNVMNSKRVKDFKRIPAPLLDTCSDCQQLTTCLGCVAQGLEYAKMAEGCKWKTLINRNGVSIDEFT